MVLYVWLYTVLTTVAIPKQIFILLYTAKTSLNLYIVDFAKAVHLAKYKIVVTCIYSDKKQLGLQLVVFNLSEQMEPLQACPDNH